MKPFKAVLFDLNGTLINIWTDETDNNLYRTVANFLSSHDVAISPECFRERYYEIMREQRHQSGFEFPEFDVVAIFDRLIEEYQREPLADASAIATTAAEIFRAASMVRLETYPRVHEILQELQQKYLLAAVSDAQRIWEDAEMRRLDLAKFFPVCIISSDARFRKPTPELFQTALARLGVEPEDAVFVGNDMFRDVFGAGQLGMKTVFFKSNQGDHEFRGRDSDYIIYRFEELKQALEFLEKNR